MQKLYIPHNTKISNLACYLVSLMCLLLFLGCGIKPRTPTENYPEQILFQHIKLKINRESIYIYINYGSNENVFLLSSDSEIHYLNINQDKYPFVPKQITQTFFTQDLLNEIVGDEDISIVLERANGSYLESSAILPGFSNITSPGPEQIINHSDEDIVIEWDLSLADASHIILSGECFNRVEYELEIGQSNLTVEANTLLGINELTECDAKISIFHNSYGQVDTSFAGGDFEIEIETQLDLYLTGIGENK